MKKVTKKGRDLYRSPFLSSSLIKNEEKEKNVCREELAKFTCSVSNHNIYHNWFLAVLFLELSNGCFDEIVVKFLGNEVDGATTETTAHDTGTSDRAILGNLVEKVKFLT